MHIRQQLDVFFEQHDFGQFIVTDVGNWRRERETESESVFTRLVTGDVEGKGYTITYTVSITDGVMQAEHDLEAQMGPQPNSAVRNDLVVWWLSQEEYGRSQALGFSRSGSPEYLIKQFELAGGRPGGGRLWLDSSLGLFGMDWGRGPVYDFVGSNCAGIVVRKEDAHHVNGWPGMVTDRYMQVWRQPDPV